MNTTKISFNLIDKPWIPCLSLKGKSKVLSLTDFFSDAHNLREIDGNPLVIASLQRFFLAIVHRVFDIQTDKKWQELLDMKKFDMDKIHKYFKKWHDRFDIFDNKYPFYQCVDIKENKKSINSLDLVLSSANNTTLFDHTLDRNCKPMTPAEAAINIIVLQNYGGSGRGYQVGALTQGVVVNINGKNLFEKIIYNTIPSSKKTIAEINKQKNIPVWEQEGIFQTQTREPFGYMDYLTWQNKKILLCPVVLENNVIEIRDFSIDQGLKFPKSQGKIQYPKDPFMMYKENAKGLKPIELQENRTVWRDCLALMKSASSVGDKNLKKVYSPIIDVFAGHIESERVKNQSVYQITLLSPMYTDSHKTKMGYWDQQAVKIPIEYLEDEEAVDNLVHILGKIEDIYTALNKTLDNLLKETKFWNSKGGVSNLKNIGAICYWQAIEPEFPKLLKEMLVDSEKTEQVWFIRLESLAKEAYDLVSMKLSNRAIVQKEIQKNRNSLEKSLNKILK